MLGSDMLDAEAFRLFRRHVKNAFAFRAQRHFDRRRNALANRDARFDLFANRLNRALLPQKTVRQRLVLAHQAEQQMFRLNIRTAVLTRFVACKKYDAPRFFCIAFEHVNSFLPRWPPACPAFQGRSEEHTSELQSPCNLVCRLLLEKKKKAKM